MSQSQATAIAVLVAAAIVSFALTQPDFVLPPLVKLLLGCANVGLTTLALYVKVTRA